MMMSHFNRPTLFIDLYSITCTQGASQVNLHSEIIKPLWVCNTKGSDEHF